MSFRVNYKRQSTVRFMFLVIIFIIASITFGNFIMTRIKKESLSVEERLVKLRQMDFDKIKTLREDKEYDEMAEEILSQFENDAIYFPIPISTKNPKRYVNYIDSWGYDRLYGGERVHEGTDIMADYNVRGYYPVISICDGVVEKTGWLELGGFRLGIRSKSGGYFYYAHLYDYAEGIEEGVTVKAGQLIGYMGDSGYSKVEGTTGNFDVHLHLGIYVEFEGNEISVNPYHLLKNLQIIKANY